MSGVLRDLPRKLDTLREPRPVIDQILAQSHSAGSPLHDAVDGVDDLEDLVRIVVTKFCQPSVEWSE